MEKELVFVRKVKGGIPKSIDNIFENKVKLSEDKYKYGVVSTTADGASVNFGKYRGLMTRMKSESVGKYTLCCLSIIIIVER